MIKQESKLHFLLFIFFFASAASASSLKGSVASGVNEYQDFGLSGKWSLKNDQKLLTSIQSTNSSGITTNEYRIGYESKINEVSSYDLSAYYRAESSNVHVIGFEPSYHFDEESLIFSDLNTGFNIGLNLSRSSTSVQVGSKKMNQSFTTSGISLGVSQDVLEDLNASLGASFYKYTEPQSRFATNKKKLINLVASDGALSTSGNPEQTFTFGLNWEFIEKWSSSYSISSTETHFDDLTTIYSSVTVDHTFSDGWSAGLGYSWSSGSSSAGSLDTTYTW